nr:TonB-dependent receptor [Chitinophagaceae bacterium]
KGFSAPTLAEIKPSDGNFYNNLKAEFGWNFELGIKGNYLNNRLQFDIAAYTIKLNNAIVRRNNVSGTEYFVNAGEAEQKGIETTIQYQLLQKNTGFVRSIQFNNSNSFQPYKFINYTVGNTNFSGNSITGVPKQIHVFSIAIFMVNNIALNVQYNYTSTIPLTDANDAFANDYRLLQLKISVPFNTKKMATQFFIGADNILNEQYSLGNDINAAGRRFYNPAPTRNYFAGCSIQLD